MSKLLEKTRYLTFIGVISLLLAAIGAFIWGIFQTIHAIEIIFSSLGMDAGITVALVEIVDSFLVATTLLIFSINLYELFIADITLPEWMVAHNLYELKTKLSSMIILVIAVKFVEKLVDVKDYGNLLQFGISAALICFVLIAFGHFGHKD